MLVTAAPAPGTNFTRPDLQQYLDQRVDRLESPGGVSTALIQGDDEADGLIELAAAHEDAVVIMSSNHGKAGGLGAFATKVVTERGAPGDRPPRLTPASRGALGGDQADRVGGRCAAVGSASTWRARATRPSSCGSRRRSSLGLARSAPIASMKPDTLTPYSVETSSQVAWASSDR